MKRGWVVIGETGEYSDRCVWLVAILPTEAEAQAEVTRISTLWRVLSTPKKVDGFLEDGYEAVVRARDEMVAIPNGDSKLPQYLYQSEEGSAGVRYRYEGVPLL